VLINLASSGKGQGAELNIREGIPVSDRYAFMPYCQVLNTFFSFWLLAPDS